MLKKICSVLCSVVLSVHTLFGIILSCAAAENAETGKEPLCISLQDENRNNTYQAFQGPDGEYYLYLPVDSDSSSKTIMFNRVILDTDGGTLTGENSIKTDESIQDLHVTDNDGQSFTVHIRQSELECVSVILSGTTLEDIYANPKSVRYNDNTVSFSSGKQNRETIGGTEIKGRGNFTWGLDKRSFQIKLPQRIPVFGMTEAKTWVLVPNYLDNSLLRNKLALDLARDMGLEYALDSRFVDLWIDGEYLGNYLLTEKVQIGPARVALQDELGVLVELDNIYYEDEKIHEQSQVSQTMFVLKDSVAKDPEGTLREEAFRGFMDFLNRFEEALFTHADWNDVKSYMDVGSFVKLFFLQELSEDSDGLRSSFFLYRDGNADVIHLGPAWDYDVAFGNFEIEKRGGNPQVDYVEHIAGTMEVTYDLYGQLLRYDEFRELLKEYYQNELTGMLGKLDVQITEYAFGIASSAEMNFKRWHTQGKEALFDGGHANQETFQEEVEYLRHWVKERIEYLDSRWL